MSDLDELWDTIITEVRAVPAVSSVKPVGAGTAVAAALTSDDLAARSPISPVLVQERDARVEIEVNIGVLAEVSAAATGLAVGHTIAAVLEGHRIGERRVVVRVLSIGH